MDTIAVVSYTKSHTSKFPVTLKCCDVFIINQDDTNRYLSNMSSYNGGSKWENILWFLEEMTLWDDYAYMWFPDETIAMDEGTAKKYLDLVTTKSFLISQPSVDLRCRNLTHKVLLTDKKQFFRRSGFVGIDAPCFHMEFVKNSLLPFLKENRDSLKSGWGLDMWWSQLNSNDVYIVDTVSMHIHPQKTEIAQIGIQEKDSIVKKYNLKSKI